MREGEIKNIRFKRGLWVLALLSFVVAGASCARLDSSRTENQTKVMSENQSVSVIYTALGDSTVAGVGTREGGGYVARLFVRIKKERTDARLTNLCVSGATTEDVLRDQLTPAINSRPTLITLGIGINDIGHGMAIQEFGSNYEDIVKRLKSETQAAIVLTNIPDISFAPVIAPSARRDLRDRIILFNERIEAVAKRYELSMVDVYSETHKVLPSHPEMFSDDGFHPSDAGYEYWAETMWPTVKTILSR